MATQTDPEEHKCSLLIFLAIEAEEIGLVEAAGGLGIPLETVRKKKSKWPEDYHRLGLVGNETVIAVGPARHKGNAVMGPIGRLGTAARGIRLRDATGARGIIQLGMGFGVDPSNQRAGDVLVSTSLIPYDIWGVKPETSWFHRLIPETGYRVEYPQSNPEPARPELVRIFREERRRGNIVSTSARCCRGRP